jgi:hypothetical protein
MIERVRWEVIPAFPGRPAIDVPERCDFVGFLDARVQNHLRGDSHHECVEAEYRGDNENERRPRERRSRMKGASIGIRSSS